MAVASLNDQPLRCNDPDPQGRRKSDLAAIVALLADDMLGRGRELVSEPLSDDYSPHLTPSRVTLINFLTVMADDGELVGMLQLSFIPGLSRRGAQRALIEAVRIAKSARRRLAEQLFEWAIAESRRRGCALIQLTSDRERAEAHRSTNVLGFEPTHVGYKLKLGE